MPRSPSDGSLRATRSSISPALAIAGLAMVLMGTSAAAAGPAAVVRDGPNDRREVALTIDDGYDTGVCRQMVRTLRAMDVPATFFPIGKNVKDDPAFWKIVSRDFPIANHTGFHGLLPPLEDERIRRQIRSAEWAVRNATGKPIMKVLRPPGGAWDDRVRRIAGSLGYRVLLTWDVTSADTGLRSTPKSMLRAATRGGRGSVILMHCNRQVSADILPQVIRAYRKRGFRFVTVDRLLERRGIKIAPFQPEAGKNGRTAGEGTRQKARNVARQEAPVGAQSNRSAPSESGGELVAVSQDSGWWSPINEAIELLLRSIVGRT